MHAGLGLKSRVFSSRRGDGEALCPGVMPDSLHLGQGSFHRTRPWARRKEYVCDSIIKAKLRRGTFAATFLLATLAALEMDGVRLEDL